jgi:hypothetical protein
VLNLRVDFGDLGFVPLALRHQCREVVSRNERKLGLKFGIILKAPTLLIKIKTWLNLNNPPHLATMMRLRQMQAYQP